MKTRIFQVGSAQAPEQDDPMFDNLESAINEARARNEESPDTVLAIWQLSNPGIAPEIRYLIYQGEFFEPTGIR